MMLTLFVAATICGGWAAKNWNSNTDTQLPFFYHSDEIQYYPPASEFNLAAEAARMKELVSNSEGEPSTSDAGLESADK